MLKLAPPNEVENAVCENVTADEVDSLLKDVIPEMEALLNETGGVGLAAPQVGIKKKFFIVKLSDGSFKTYFNAFYTKNAEKTKTREGCLTYGKDIFTTTTRWKSIRFVYEEYDPEKKTLTKKNKVFKGYDAIILQHESDHLRGVTIFMQ